MDQGQRSTLLRWPGLMGDTSTVVRRAGIVLLIVASCTMAATQTNYFVVGNAHLIAVLAPITVCALLYGALPATLAGGLAGVVEWLHATYIPLDAYERYFAVPFNSLGLFAIMGLVMGVMFALAARRGIKSRAQGVIALLGACTIGSALFTALFTAGANLINSLLNLEIPTEIVSDLTGNRELFSQILANFGLMSILSLVAAEVARRHVMDRREPRIRETFQSWLAVVVTLAYLVAVAFGYTIVTIRCLNDANTELQGQISYLFSQLGERDRILEGIQRRLDVTEGAIREVHESSIASIATGLRLGRDGISVVAEDGEVVSSTDPSYIGMPFSEVVASGLVGGFDETVYDADRPTLWYIGNNKMGYMRSSQMGYVRVSDVGDYQVMAVLPADEVFEYRTYTMIALSIVCVLLFASVYVQASLLLKNVVVRSIDETNEMLGRITDGDLAQVVDVRDTVEFTNLSAGINATVSSLKNAIAAEGARIERDLMTAKAIQESALPQVFPPFPEISAFDIYAHMWAAREVGGDFYDIFLVNDHTLCFLIADVSGKGIPASLFMMASKTEIANNVKAGMDLAVAIQTANWHLCQGNDAGMFVTVWAATLDWQTGKLTYVNAGHNPPLLRHEGSWEWLTTRGGLFLGTFDSAKYRSSTIDLVAGDELLLYTDGVNEAFSADDEEYGDGRLMEFLEGHAQSHPHALVDTLREDLAHWAEGAEQSDDITILSLEYGVPPEATGSVVVPATKDHLNDVFTLIHDELASRVCPITVQHQVDIVIEELFVNVCNYAYAEADGPGEVRIDYVYNANPNAITVSLTDWGVPFNPLGHDDPTAPNSIEEAKIGGLGIMMVKRMTDDLAYERDGDANVIVFRKVW